ncbi:hypothetical protein QN224_14255 [Sinorhizobium sp. 8-89]|uniref:hypothetical protein n=1 Tax=Sinorhizobium sp. 7-81 TaxID=3049087 RepID=UPI0024C3D77E|nr:hypothetical protein [Sinorhizobium sp. 7-81]MDK1386570.1 hypothetical protein [Sinorhizobium sp. 7-81]
MTSAAAADGRRFAAVIVATNDPAADPVCSYVFPVIMNTDGQLITATKEFPSRSRLSITAVYVEGISDRLCGIVLDGHYRELRD